MPGKHCAAPLHIQRGAVGIFGALVFGMVVAFVILALDTGRLALEKRRLQEIADLAAIDALQQAGLCSGNESMTTAAVQAAAQQSAARNGYAGDLNGEVDAVLLGTMTTDAAGVRQFTATVDAAATAVRVTARKQVVRSLIAGGWYDGTVDLQAVGVAQREPLAGFSVGSFLASIDSEDSAVLDAVLGEMLGSAISLDAVSYQGLAAANLTVAQLIGGAALAGVSLSTNSVEGLLTANVTVAELLSIMATALGAEGDDTAAAAVNEMRTAATVAGTLSIGELLSVSANNPESALESEVNAYTLGSAALQLAREGETLTVPISATLPIVGTTITVSLHITEAPQVAVGPPGRDVNGNWKTAASTAQLQMQTEVIMANVPLDVVGNVSMSLPIAVELARTTAWLASIQCSSASQLAHRATVSALPGVANVALGRYTDIYDPATLVEGAMADVTLLNASTATVDISAVAVGRSDATQDVVFDVSVDPLDPPRWNLPQQETVGSPLASTLGDTTQSLADSLQVNATALGVLPLGVTTGTIGSTMESVVLDPVLTAVDEKVLLPVFQALGINLGGADIELLSLKMQETRLVR